MASFTGIVGLAALYLAILPQCLLSHGLSGTRGLVSEIVVCTGQTKRFVSHLKERKFRNFYKHDTHESFF